MSQQDAGQPTGTNVEVIPDLFGYTLYLSGRRFFIPGEQLGEVVSSLARWLEPTSKSPPIVATALLEEADQFTALGRRES